MPQPLAELLKQIQGRKLDSEAEIDALFKEQGLDEDQAEIAKSAIKMIALAGDDAADAIVKALTDSDDGDGNDGNDGGDGNDDGTENRAGIMSFVKRLFGSGRESESDDMDLNDVPEDVQPVVKSLVAMQQEIQKQRDEFRKERDAALEELREARIAKEKAEWKARIDKAADVAGIDREVLAAAMQSFASQDSESAEAIAKAIAGMSEQIDKSALFGELGIPGHEPSEGSALAELDRLAKEKQEKSSEPLSIHKARDIVLQENVELRKRYRAERRTAQA